MLTNSMFHLKIPILGLSFSKLVVLVIEATSRVIQAVNFLFKTSILFSLLKVALHILRFGFFFTLLLGSARVISEQGHV